MSFTNDEARLIAGYLLSQYEQEMETTRKVLEALPEGQEAWAPDPRSTPALKLAWHIASAEKWFLDSIAKGRFEAGDSSMPAAIRTGAGVAAWYAEHLPPSLARLKELPGEAFSRELDFLGMGRASGLFFLALGLKHSIHHRGQLSAYIRPMGGRVPGIYGPSGDSA
mgnify:CR=1 FL=1